MGSRESSTRLLGNIFRYVALHPLDPWFLARYKGVQRFI
jgi:hypothetical protein